MRFVNLEENWQPLWWSRQYQAKTGNIAENCVWPPQMFVNAMSRSTANILFSTAKTSKQTNKAKQANKQNKTKQKTGIISTYIFSLCGLILKDALRLHSLEHSRRRTDHTRMSSPQTQQAWSPTTELPMKMISLV